MMTDAEPEIVEEIRAANQRFYDAFNTLDIGRMEDVWETSGRALCVHPGWTPIVGWDTIRESWERIFDNANLMQFSVRYLNVVVQGDFGCVTCVEGVTSVVQGRAANFSTFATNIFARQVSENGDVGWKMITHHASPGG